MGRYKISIGFLMGAAVLLSILLVCKQEPLPEYHEQEKTEPAIEQALPEMYNYSTDLYEISVPVGWKEVIRDGTTCFVDPSTASVLEIGYMPYYPQINMMTSEKAGYNLGERGFTLSEYVRTASDSYKCTYSKDGIAYLEYVYWDFDKVYTITGKYKSDNYSAVYDVLIGSLESFRHFGAAIPVGWRVLYYEYGYFSVLAKDDWGYAESSDTITFADPTSGSNISVKVTPTNEDFTSIDQLSFTQNAAADKHDYIQSSYINTGSEIYSAATYSTNGYTMTEYIYGIASGKYVYWINATIPINCECSNDIHKFIECFTYDY